MCHGAPTQLELEGNTKLYGPVPPAGPGPRPGTRMTEPEGVVIVILRLLVVTEYNPCPTDTGSVAASLSDVSLGPGLPPSESDARRQLDGTRARELDAEGGRGGAQRRVRTSDLRL